MSTIYIEANHPAANRLKSSGIQVSSPDALTGQQPLRVGFINLMPKPVDPVVDFGTLFAGQNAHNVQIIDFGPTPTLYSKTPEKQALRKHLRPLRDLAEHNLDGIILTGYGKEELAFETINFWKEVETALDHVKEKKIPMLASCWGSHAALHYYHGVHKDYDMSDKISGIFEQAVLQKNHPFMHNISDSIPIPVSRYGRSCDKTIENNPDLIVLAKSEETGTAIVTDTDGDVLYLTGHPEYNADSLPGEYFRDLEAGTPHLRVPANVFGDNKPHEDNILPASWQRPAKILAKNWLDAVANRKGITQNTDRNVALIEPRSIAAVLTK